MFPWCRPLKVSQINSLYHYFNKGVHIQRCFRNIVVLCPGQGAQYIGMFQMVDEFLTTGDFMKISNAILGYDLQKFGNNGPKEMLDRTIHCQPAIILSSILAFEKLKYKMVNEGNTELKINSIAGYSVGELSALYIADGISFTDVMSLVKARAEAMQYASDLNQTGMLSMQGLSLEQANELCADITHTDINSNHYIQVAIQQYYKSVSLGGSLSMLNKVMNREHVLLSDETKVKLSKLPVSGAFHTNYMQPAQNKLHKTLQNINILPNRTPLYSNLTGELYRESDNIREYLVRHICEVVKWYPILQSVNKDFDSKKVSNIYELGPGRQLKAMMGKVNRKAMKKIECF